MNDVTAILARAGNGDSSATDELLPLVYDQLRQLARREMARERAQTLQPTALVHEAYLRLVGKRRVEWANRAHFFAAAAEAMRRILVDAARKRGRLKRGGNLRRLPMSVADLIPERDAPIIEALDRALKDLALEDGRMQRVVMLRFFGGLSIDETAKAMGISSRTVKREWTCARAWLYQALRDEVQMPGEHAR